MQDLYDAICKYITEEWIGTSSDSARKFATNHDIDEKTVRRIKEWKKLSYRIALSTLERICASRNLTLHDFFRLLKR
jgi:DNA-binding Xre family transcriptional regulator